MKLPSALFLNSLKWLRNFFIDETKIFLYCVCHLHLGNTFHQKLEISPNHLNNVYLVYSLVINFNRISWWFVTNLDFAVFWTFSTAYRRGWNDFTYVRRGSYTRILGQCLEYESVLRNHKMRTSDGNRPPWNSAPYFSLQHLHCYIQ